MNPAGAASSAGKGARGPLLTAPFVLILVATALFGLAFSSYFLLPKFLATELAADPAAIGGLSAIAMFASVLFMPIVGGEVDRRGRRPISTLGAGIFAIASAGMLLVNEVGPLIWLLRGVHGAAFTLFLISLSTLATDLAPPQRLGQAIGLYGGVMISTNALGPALAEWAAHQYGWAAVFAATAVAAGLAALLTTFISEQAHEHGDEAQTGMPQLVTRPGLRRVLVVAIFTGCVLGTAFTFYQPWALDQGIEHVSSFLIAFAGCAMLVRFGLGGLADRLGRMRVAVASLFVYIAAPLALIPIDTLGLVLPGCLLGLSHGLFFPAMNAVALGYARNRERGKAMAAYHGAFNVGFAGGSYLLGYLAMATSYPTIFVIAGVICAMAFVLLATAPRPQP